MKKANPQPTAPHNVAPFTDVTEAMSGERLRLLYIPLDQAALWDENPKERSALSARVRQFFRQRFVMQLIGTSPTTCGSEIRQRLTAIYAAWFLFVFCWLAQARHTFASKPFSPPQIGQTCL